MLEMMRNIRHVYSDAIFEPGYGGGLALTIAAICPTVEHDTVALNGYTVFRLHDEVWGYPLICS